MERPPLYKMINGRKYKLFAFYRSKNIAQEWARDARKQRKSARVIKHMAPLSVKWCVYVYREKDK